MSNCYICGKEINKENQSEEHIISNAIGGKLRDKNLICEICNNQTFHDIDTALANQLNVITCLLNPKRDRKGVKISIEGTIADSEELIYLEAGGKPVICKKAPLKTENGYKLESRDLKHLKEQLGGLAKKNSWINVEKIMEEVKEKIESGEIETQHYLDNPILISSRIGGDEFWRAICKMATNFYIHKRGNKEYISHLISYIKGEATDKKYSYFYYPNNLEHDIEDRKVIHSLHIKGDSEKRILYCFVQIYSAFQFIVLLNGDYSGETINETYSFDIINQENLENSINLKINLDEIKRILNFQSTTAQTIKQLSDIRKKKIENLLDLIKEKQIVESLNKNNKRVIDEFFDQREKEENIADEYYLKFCEQLALNMMKCLYPNDFINVN